MATRGGRVRRVLAVLACALAAVALGAGPAAAHDELLGSLPAAGSTVDSAPDQVVLMFAEPAVAIGTMVTVTGPDGAKLAQGDAQLVGSTVVQALAAGRPAGTYTVDWRVTSADGHPVTGSFTFTATRPAVVATQPAATQPAATTPSPAATPTASATPAAGATPTSSPTSSRGALVVMGIVVVALLLTRLGRAQSLRRITPKADGPAAGDDPTDSAGPAGGA